MKDTLIGFFNLKVQLRFQYINQMITLPFVWTNKTTNLELAVFHIQLFKLEAQKNYKKCL
jgi:hypothetical protein